jgi:hypothetical protein
MRQPAEEAREAPSSLAPVSVERPSYDQDLASMRGRRTPRIVIAVALLAVAGLGGWRLLRSMDAKEAYAQAAAQLERSEVEQREAFMRCVLPNQQRSLLNTPSALQSAIEIASQRMGKTYARVLTQCVPLLETFQQSVAGIKAPADSAPRVQAVSRAANDFAAAWLRLRDFVQSPEQADSAQAAPYIQAITASWQAYDQARTKAQAALSARS